MGNLKKIMFFLYGIVVPFGTAAATDATMEIKAGIGTGVSLQCEALSFGLTIIPNGDLDSETTLSLDSEGSITGGSAAEYSNSGGSAGECTITHNYGTEFDKDKITVDYSTSDITLGPSAVLGLEAAPNAGGADVPKVVLDDPTAITGTAITEQGDNEATFKVTGELILPSRAPDLAGGWDNTDTTVSVTYDAP